MHTKYRLTLTLSLCLLAMPVLTGCPILDRDPDAAGLAGRWILIDDSWLEDWKQSVTDYAQTEYALILDIETGGDWTLYTGVVDADTLEVLEEGPQEGGTYAVDTDSNPNRMTLVIAWEAVGYGDIADIPQAERETVHLIWALRDGDRTLQVGQNEWAASYPDSFDTADHVMEWQRGG